MAAKTAGMLSKIGNIGSLFKVLFTLKGAVSFTLIIIVIMSLGAIQQSFKEGTPLPAIKKMGGELINHDSILYAEVVKLEQKRLEETQQLGFFENIWENLKVYWRLFINLWYLWTFGTVFFFISANFIVNNKDATLSNIFVAILLLSVLQIGANFIIIDENITADLPEVPTSEKFIPFRGVMKLAGFLPELVNTNNNNLTVNDSLSTFVLANETKDEINTLTDKGLVKSIKIM